MDQPKDIMEKKDRKPQETWTDSVKESRHVKKTIPGGGSWTEVHTQVLTEQRKHLFHCRGLLGGARASAEGLAGSHHQSGCDTGRMD